MMKRKASAIIFYDAKGNILIQDRKKISKWGEEYGFFGGKIELNESPEEAIKREIKEELGIEIKEFTIFKHHFYSIKKSDLDVEVFCFISKMPDLKILNVQEGELAFMKYKESLNLKFLDGDKFLLNEFGKFLNENTTF